MLFQAHLSTLYDSHVCSAAHPPGSTYALGSSCMPSYAQLCVSMQVQSAACPTAAHPWCAPAPGHSAHPPAESPLLPQAQAPCQLLRLRSQAWHMSPVSAPETPPWPTLVAASLTAIRVEADTAADCYRANEKADVSRQSSISRKFHSRHELIISRMKLTGIVQPAMCAYHVSIQTHL